MSEEPIVKVGLRQLNDEQLQRVIHHEGKMLLNGEILATNTKDPKHPLG